MELKSKNNQEVLKSQMISLIISFIFFNAILKDADWLILSCIVLLVVLTIIYKIWGKKWSEAINKSTNISRRML